MTTPENPKPLTSGQARCAKAWDMVLTHSTGNRRFAFTGQQIADASGVSLRTVASMREFLQTFRERGLEPSGVWTVDRNRAARPVPMRGEPSLVRLQQRAGRLVRQARA